MVIRIRFDCEVARKGAVLLPIKEIVNILSQSKQDMLWLEVKNDKIVMRGEGCGQWEFSLQCPDNMPDVAEFTAKSYHKIPKKELQRMIRHTIFAVNENNARFTLAGVCFECQMAKDSPNEDVITAVATDGRRLAIQKEYTERILKSHKRGKIVFMEWNSGFVYHIPALCCKKSNGQGFTILSITDSDLSSNKHFANMFAARSLF